MDIVLIAAGSRGDVQPMIALGKGLQAAGHQVRLIAGSNFESWIISHGLSAFPTVDTEALMHTENGLRWTEAANQLEQLKVMKELTHQVKGQTEQDLVAGTQGADLVIGGFVSEPYLQTLHEKFGVRLLSAALQNYRTTREGSASMFAVTPGRSVLNLLGGKFVERMTWGIASEAVNEFRAGLGLPPHTASSFITAANQIPAIVGVSPHVIPPVNDANVTITGYWFLDEPYAPPPDLVSFLGNGEPPVYVGFGSMPSRDPQATIRLISAALAQAGQRGVIAKGWGGTQISDLPESIYLLDQAPHSWLFPQMQAIVHHGGAGTTAAALRAGKPMFIIPHMADQPYWGRRVYDLKVGIKPVPRRKLTTNNFASGITELITSRQLRDNAAALGEAVRNERGVEVAVQWIDRFIASK